MMCQMLMLGCSENTVVYDLCHFSLYYAQRLPSTGAVVNPNPEILLKKTLMGLSVGVKWSVQ